MAITAALAGYYGAMANAFERIGEIVCIDNDIRITPKMLYAS